MDNPTNLPWLKWARELQAMGQTGLFYSPDAYHTKRYLRLQEIAAEMIHYRTGAESQKVLEGFVAQTGYSTPKVDVRGAVFRQNKVLLVKEKADHQWSLPGGWADVGDLPSEMVTREVYEESGMQVRPVKLIGLYDANRVNGQLAAYHAYKVIFLCEILGGVPTPGDETLAVDFFPFSELPELSLLRTSRSHLAEAFAHLHDKSRPAAFD